MYKYNKMKTLFIRDEHFKVTDKVSCKEFLNINKWLVTEKVDGTNIRIIYRPKQTEEYRNNPATLEIKGKQEKSDMPSYLLRVLNRMFDLEKFMEIFPDVTKGVCLYGEGYGAKIRSGGSYNIGHSFRLFDVWLDGWWLEWDNVENIAKKLGIKTVPVIMETTLEEAVELVKRKTLSEVALEEAVNYHVAEGIVARAYPMVLFRNGTPVKWKLKVKDYPPLDDNGVRLTAEEHRKRHLGGLITDTSKAVLKNDGGYLMKVDSKIYKDLSKQFNDKMTDKVERQNKNIID